jgi:hypothetical protein
MTQPEGFGWDAARDIGLAGHSWAGVEADLLEVQVGAWRGALHCAGGAAANDADGRAPRDATSGHDQVDSRAVGQIEVDQDQLVLDSC